MVIVAPNRSVVHEDPSCRVHKNCGDYSEYITVQCHFLDHKEQDPKDHNPEKEKQADCTSAVSSFALGRRCYQKLSPVPKAEEDRYQCAPAEPVQGRQSQILKNAGFRPRLDG